MLYSRWNYEGNTNVVKASKTFKFWLFINYQCCGNLCSVRLFTYLTYSSHREFSIDESHLSSDSSKGSAHNHNSQTLSTRKKCALRYILHRGWTLALVIYRYCWTVQWGSPMTQICLTLTKALWMSWMFGRHLSRSDLMTSLRCGWLFVMAVKTLPQNKTNKDDWIREVLKQL